MSARTSVYRKAILVFGFVLPGFFAAAIIGGLLYTKSELQSSMAEKRKLFSASEKSRLEIEKTEKRLIRQRPLAALWAASVEEESAKSLTDAINKLQNQLPEGEFQPTSNRAAGRGAFSTSPAYPSTELQLSFRATYRSMQLAFLEIESRMPQLQLQTLKVERTPNGQNLTFQVTYTAWEK